MVYAPAVPEPAGLSSTRRPLAAPASPPPLVPPGWRLLPAHRTYRSGDGTTLLGGSPLRVLRFTRAGAAAVERWWDGEPVGSDPGQRRLARRLLDAELAHPDPPRAGGAADVTVVIPVRDRPEELHRCLAAIDPRYRVLVIDDESASGAAIAGVARSAGASLVRLEPGRGPAAARNEGLRRVETPFVAFVDSDCVVGPSFPGRLLDHLADPALAIVAPRIVALTPEETGLLARYETHHSALDMGPRAGIVRAGSAIPYAPSAALVARADALGAGFDEKLTMGEDVDLLWRLTDAGWQVRYDPAVTVAHDHRVAFAPWFARRVAYNRSNARLLRRHPGKVPALSISRGSAVFWATAALGGPAAAAAVTLVRAALLGRGLHPYVVDGRRVALRLVVLGQLHEGRHLGRALTGPWLPFLVAGTALRPRAALRLWLGVAAGALWEWAEERRAPTPIHYVVPKAAEDVARCIGVWWGCAEERRVGALMPQLRRRFGGLVTFPWVR